MDLNENTLDLGSCTNPKHSHSPTIRKAIHVHQTIGTKPMFLRAIDASTYEIQRKTERDLAYQVRILKARAESAYQYIQLR
jgi:hypothetical protein